MFIIFLGVVPLLAIVAFLTYYARHNLKFGTNKSTTSTYVPKWLKHVFKGVGTSYKKPDPIPTVSDNVSNKNSKPSRPKIEMTSLLSTTNTDCIIRSNTINNNSNRSNNTNKPEILPKQERRMSLKNVKNLKLNTNIRLNKNKDKESSSNSPQTCETIVDDTPQLSVRDLAKRLESKKIGLSNG